MLLRTYSKLRFGVGITMATRNRNEHKRNAGFVYSHTEENKPVPLMNDFRTEHFTKITLEDWKKRIGGLK